MSAHPMLRRLAAAATASGAAVLADAPDPRARSATIDMPACLLVVGLMRRLLLRAGCGFVLGGPGGDLWDAVDV